MIAVLVILTACCLLVGTVIARTTGRISRRTFYALIAASNGVALTASVANHDQGPASINAASMAISAWLWWQDGGGDDTKRRLRRWARKFQGVRRTAPVGAA